MPPPHRWLSIGYLSFAQLGLRRPEGPVTSQGQGDSSGWAWAGGRGGGGQIAQCDAASTSSTAKPAAHAEAAPTEAAPAEAGGMAREDDEAVEAVGVDAFVRVS